MKYFSLLFTTALFLSLIACEQSLESSSDQLRIEESQQELSWEDWISTNTAENSETTIKDLRERLEYGRQNYLQDFLKDCYVTSIRQNGFTIQQSQDGDGIFVFTYTPPTDIKVGNKINLTIYSLKNHRGLAEITDYKILSNDRAEYDVLNKLSINLSDNGGILSKSSLQSKLIHIPAMKFSYNMNDIASNEQSDWLVKYAGHLKANVHLDTRGAHSRVCQNTIADAHALIGEINFAGELYYNIKNFNQLTNIDQSECAEPLDLSAPVIAPIEDSPTANTLEISDLTVTNETHFWDHISSTLNGEFLKEEIFQTLKENHRVISYYALSRAYLNTDGQGFGGCPSGKIWDIYSSKCWHPRNKCGAYREEGDCYNKEHVWPQSWGASGVAHSDLHHVLASDGKVNGLRSNYPFGIVTTGSEIEITGDGHKLGYCEAAEGTDLCFEPNDEIKGDIARAILYYSVRYKNRGSTRVYLWMKNILKDWTLIDPVSEREIARNNVIEDLQGNRNPFVDHPEWVFKITNF